MKIICPECQTKMEIKDGAFLCPKCDYSLRFEDDFIRSTKEKLKSLKEQLGDLSLAQLKENITNPKHPVTMLLIGFIAWGIVYALRFPIFMAIVTAFSILLGPWGIVLIAILPLVYKYHRETIEKEKEKHLKKRAEEEKTEESAQVDPDSDKK